LKAPYKLGTNYTGELKMQLFCGIIAPAWGWFDTEIWSRKSMVGRNGFPLQSVVNLFLKDKCFYLCYQFISWVFIVVYELWVFSKIYVVLRMINYLHPCC
jgi:hypothetical protein